MESRQRIVARMPLAELWDSKGPISAVRGQPLGAPEIKDLLRSGPVNFACANIGEPLRWVPESESFDFWKQEVKPHLVALNNVDAFFLDDFPQGYCYVATKWTSANNPPIVLLETFH